jgi:isopenicillin-N N-acyltransferase like protein
MRSTVLALALLAQTSHAAFCHSSPDDGERVSAYPIFDETKSGDFVRSVENAAIYQAGPDTNRFSVVHVWGTPYEQGFAQGKLLSEDLKKCVKSNSLSFLVEEIPSISI